MKALVVGGGSIGARHFNNLKALGIGSLEMVEPDAQRRFAAYKNGLDSGFASLAEGLEWNPDIVVIATPSHLHIEQALLAARKGCHLFIEKPLSHNHQGLDELLNEISQSGATTLVGCNMRFHPGPAKVKELLERESIGRVLFARIYTGSYLPGWRTTQDYRLSYSATKEMGGGCLLDCIHEIDLARWYLGDIKDVFCLADHLSSLEMNVEDVAALICRHTDRAFSEIHLDYVQRTYERGCQIVGENGSIFWNYNDCTVRWFDAKCGCWTTFPQAVGWQTNQMYMDELQHFLECVNRRRQTVFPVEEANEVMRIALAAKASAESGCVVSTRKLS